MGDKRQLAMVALISTAGLWLILMGAYIGASHAASPTPPPLPAPWADGANLAGALFDAAAVGTLQRAQTVTLKPALNDMMSDTWPICVQDLIYNWPAGADLLFPADAWDVRGGTLAGPLIITSTTINFPDSQTWITLTYCTRQSNWRSLAVRGGDLVTLSSRVTFGGGMFYDPLTATLVYTRQIPLKEGQPQEDYWGFTVAQLLAISPPPTEQSVEEGWARWVAPHTSDFTNAATLREPLFGSDLTVTQFLMEPPVLELGKSNVFTVTLTNMGAVTAYRWFATELYIRPETDPPPEGPYDHAWGLITYRGDALFHKPGTPGDWPVPELGPGQSITLETLITVTGFMTGDRNYRAYAQVDTGYLGDPYHYAGYGSNSEGYGVPPFPEEQNNVAIIGPILYIPATYRLEASPSATGMAPPGKYAAHFIVVTNTGNVEDWYTVTVASSGAWFPRDPVAVVGPVLNLGYTQFRVDIGVPPDAHEGDSHVATATLMSRGDPSQTADVTLVTTAGWYRIYLPIIRKTTT